jgi:hypothetical protein
MDILGKIKGWSSSIKKRDAIIAVIFFVIGYWSCSGI